MLKRLFDITFSFLGLVMLSPFLLWLAWRIQREDGGPVFYRGERVGLYGKPFRIFKFRTMVVDAEKLSNLGQPPFSTHDYPEDKLEVLIVDGE